jgi:hypothetical protein
LREFDTISATLKDSYQMQVMNQHFRGCAPKYLSHYLCGVVNLFVSKGFLCLEVVDEAEI